MPGQRIDVVLVKPWTEKVNMDECILEQGPCHRPTVNGIKSGEFYLESFDGDSTLTVYTLPQGLQLLLKEVEQLGKRRGAAELQRSFHKLMSV